MDSELVNLPGTALPPGGLIEILFSFDTTGSMSSVLSEVQGRLQDMIQRLQADIPGIRIGVIAHGDYCDKDVFYLTQQIDLCSDVKALCEFVQGVDGTGGGDQDECYELVLRMVHRDFNWTPTSTKILVMIGDANPHEPDYELNTENIDWREEVKHLHDVLGIKIYGVQVFENEGADDFYKSLAECTDGHYLKLGEFSNICDFMMAICYREKGEEFLTDYEAEVRSRFGTSGMHRDLEGLFGALRRTDSSQSTSSRTGTLASCSSMPIASVAPIPMPALVTPLAPTPASSFKRNKDPRFHTHKVSKKRKPKTSVKDISKSDEPRLNRMKSVFKCPGLKFSSWKLAWTCTKPANKQLWVKCRGIDRWKRKMLYKRNTKQAALYEVSLQSKPGSKRLVMFHAVLNGHNTLHVRNWQTSLLSQSKSKRRISKQIKTVLVGNFSIFVRRAIIGRKGTQINNVLQKYEYPWNRQPKKYLNEPILCNGTCISGFL